MQHSAAWWRCWCVINNPSASIFIGAIRIPQVGMDSQGSLSITLGSTHHYPKSKANSLLGFYGALPCLTCWIMCELHGYPKGRGWKHSSSFGRICSPCTREPAHVGQDLLPSPPCQAAHIMLVLVICVSWDPDWLVFSLWCWKQMRISNACLL